MKVTMWNSHGSPSRTISVVHNEHERALPCARSLGSCQARVTRVCHWWHDGDRVTAGADRQTAWGRLIWQGQTRWLCSYNHTLTWDSLIWQTAITLSTGGAVIAACVILGRPVTATNLDTSCGWHPNAWCHSVQTSQWHLSERCM